jgi:hypothetical protein
MTRPDPLPTLSVFQSQPRTHPLFSSLNPRGIPPQHSAADIYVGLRPQSRRPTLCRGTLLHQLVPLTCVASPPLARHAPHLNPCIPSLLPLTKGPVPVYIVSKGAVALYGRASPMPLSSPPRFRPAVALFFARPICPPPLHCPLRLQCFFFYIASALPLD